MTTTDDPRVKPKPPASVGRDELLAALARIAPQLAVDPIYAHRSNAPFDRAGLERYFAQVDGSTTLEHLFSEILQGMIQSVRHAGLRVVREIFRADPPAPITRLPGLVLREGEALGVVGDLVVDGDLENEGVLVVTGDLTIGGAYLGPSFAYSLAAVGGTMRARDVSTSGEVLVGARLEASRLIYLHYNDYSSILPIVKARALVTDDNYPALGEVEVEFRIVGAAKPDQLRAIFGEAAAVEPVDEDEDALQRLIRNG